MGNDWDWWERNRNRRPNPDDEESGCGWKILTGLLFPLAITVIGITEYIHPWS